jgi:hypothetical protein
MAEAASTGAYVASRETQNVMLCFFNEVIETTDERGDVMTATGEPGARGQEQDKPKAETTIFVNNRPVTMPGDHATGAEIKAAADVPPDFKLYDEKGKEIASDRQVRLKDAERFTAISGQDVS